DIFELSLKENNTNNNKEDVSVLIHKKGTVVSKSKISWQIPHFTEFKIDYDKLNVKTYNKEVISGKKVSELKINNNNVSIRNLIDNNINRKQVQEKLPEITSNSQKNSELDFEKETFNWSLILQFEHGNEIETTKGKSCINLIQVPISWTRKYRTIK
ncbi:MAG TPA: hypothetical protein VFD35_09330, partial [Pricia sp.]|nr:hypothetical protein [Pricia sp.]